MNRREFLQMLGVGTTAIVIPSTSFIFDFGANKHIYEKGVIDWAKVASDYIDKIDALEDEMFNQTPRKYKWRQLRPVLTVKETDKLCMLINSRMKYMGNTFVGGL